MKNKIKILAIVGESGTGKDTIAKKLCKNKKYHPIVSTTTRPKREGEIEGINYHFVSPDTFGDLVAKDKMLEATCFNDWFYGTSLDSLDKDKINVGVFNPEGLDILAENSIIDLYVAQIMVNDKIRLMRQLTREKSPNVDEIIRRYNTDKEDFKGTVIPPNTHFITLRNETRLDLWHCIFSLRRLLRQLVDTTE